MRDGLGVEPFPQNVWRPPATHYLHMDLFRAVRTSNVYLNGSI